MDDAETWPVAPAFVGHRGKRLVRISFDQERSAIITSDERGRQIGLDAVSSGSQPLELEGEYLTWEVAPGRRATPVRIGDDEYGMALAFAHFVNQRIPPPEIERVLGDPIPGVRRFQYAVINVGVFRTPERMTNVLAVAGERGWELVTVYDKASNWLSGMEKGLMLLKREIPAGVEVDRWCITLRQ